MALESAVRVRKGQVPIGRGELTLSDGILVLTVGGKERLRAPVSHVQRRLSPLFAHEAFRTPRRWVPRQRYRVTFVDSEDESAWGKAFQRFDSERERASTLDRVAGAEWAAAAGVLRDRAWHRTDAGAEEEGMLELAHDQLAFINARGETLRLPIAEIRKISAPRWRSGRVTLTAGDDRHVFGFDPKRRGDGTWEEGGGIGSAASGADGGGYVSSSQDAVDASEFANGLVLIGGLVALAFEGNYTRRVLRRDWTRVLSRERAPGELLTARAEKARAKLEQDDLLTNRF